MINVKTEELKNPIYVREIGLEILENYLGTVGTATFLQQFWNGNSNYTEERAEYLDNQTIEDFEKELAKLKAD